MQKASHCALKAKGDYAEDKFGTNDLGFEK